MNQPSETIIDCPNCGQRNRISNSSVHQNKRPICSKCWSSLVQKHEKKNVPPPPKPDVPLEEQIKNGSSDESFFNPKVIFVIIVICILGWLFLHDSSDPNRRSYSPAPPNAVPVLPPYPEQSLPYNGAVQKFTTAEAVAPLEIRGGSGSNYLVKLVNAYTNDPVMTIFVHSGSTASVDVPLGNYEFRYASGEQWYGYKYLFGPNTSYSKADKKDLALQKESKILEGHLMGDHIHMMVSIPPKYAVSQVVGYIKGKSAIQIARRYMGRDRNFTGQHFWARGYYVSTTGRDEEVIRQYIKNQQEFDQRLDQLNMF